MTNDELQFTGERFIPQQTDPLLAMEHYHRYLYASRYTKKKRVLDIACGEGYGSAFLALNAEEVLGIDSDEQTIGLAREKYKTFANARFDVGKCESFFVKENLFDVAVSFETLEHVDAEVQHQFLANIKQSLKESGILIISTPERAAYAATRDGQNEFHKHELSAVEFSEALSRHFRNVLFVGQKPLTVSTMWSLHGWKDDFFRFHVREELFSLPKSVEQFTDPVYLIAICSDEELPKQIADESKSLYYDIAQVEQTKQLLAWARKLDVELQERTAWAKRSAEESQALHVRIVSLQQEFNERSAWANNLNTENSGLKNKIAEAQKFADERTDWAKNLDAEINLHKQKIQELQKLADERTVWATKLESENGGLKARIAELQKISEERTAWAKKLDAEINLQKQKIQELQKLADERTVWAKSLDKELIERRDHLGKLQKEFEERTVWANSLAADIERERNAFKALSLKLEETRKSLTAADRKAQELNVWGTMLERQLANVSASPIYRLFSAIGLLPKITASSETDNGK